ncbi:hypothetical protein HZH66_014295 [Vespula vulgaris]|uniref:Uncharacterized protein n=1 Tax=Vespula vulgaris TaxID=7454 RepID=A0A834J377_VESVU|nr:hypothetical protein HZH66_014295 [Vespula vulgaris]
MLKPLVNSKEIVVSGSDVLNERRRITNDKAKTSYVRPLNLGNGIFAGKADTEFKKFKELKAVDTGTESTLGHEDATESQRIASSRSNGLKKKESQNIFSSIKIEEFETADKRFKSTLGYDKNATES